MKQYAILTLVLGLAASAAHAQKRLPVSLHCDGLGSDTIGKRICSGLRDALARSPRWQEVPESARGLHAMIHVQSQSIPNTDMSAQSVAFTVVLHDDEHGDAEEFMSHFVTFTGRDAVTDQVEQIMSGFDTQMHKH